MPDRAPVPVPRWEPPLARERRARSRARRHILLRIGLGLAFAGAAFTRRAIADSRPWIVWNASASAPIGLWRVHPGAAPRVGTMVLARMPAPVARLAAARHYVPATVPLLKQVAAGSGDTVCAIGRGISIDGRLVAIRLPADRSGRRMPWWSGCERLGPGRIFLLNPRPDSFDSRYFGPVDESAIIGRATPLWLR